MPEKDKKNTYTAINPKDFEYRTKMYNDSLQKFNKGEVLNTLALGLTRMVIDNKLNNTAAETILNKKIKESGVKSINKDILPENIATYTAERMDGTVVGRYKVPKYKKPVQEILPPLSAKQIADNKAKEAAMRAEARKRKATGAEKSFIADTTIDSSTDGKSLKFDADPSLPLANRGYNISKTASVSDYTPSEVEVPKFKGTLNTTTGNRSQQNPNAPYGIFTPEGGGNKETIWKPTDLNDYEILNQKSFGGMLLGTIGGAYLGNKIDPKLGGAVGAVAGGAIGNSFGKNKMGGGQGVQQITGDQIAYGGRMYDDGGPLPMMENTLQPEALPEDPILNTAPQDAWNDKEAQKNKPLNFGTPANTSVETQQFANTDNKMFNYYDKIMKQDEARNKKIAKTTISTAGMVGNIFAPGIGSAVSGAVNSTFALGGNMTEIPDSAGTHEESSYGGVPINNFNSSVEQGEVINNANNTVLSNRLTPNGSKKSYAGIMKKYNKLQKLRPKGTDKLTDDFVNLKAEELYEDQEAQKEFKGIMQNAQMVYGGMMQMAAGGNMYGRGGDMDNPIIDRINKAKLKGKKFIDNTKENLEEFEQDFKNTRRKVYNRGVRTIEDLKDFYNKKRNKNSYKNTDIANNLDNSNSPYLGPGVTASGSRLNKDKKTPSNFDAKKVIPYTQLLGPASQMFTSLLRRNEDLANLNYRTPEYTPVDPFYASAIARAQANQQEAIAKNAIRNNANTQANYLQNMAGVTANMLASPNQASMLAYQADIANQMGRNQNNALKAEAANRNIDEREKLIDNSRTQFTNSLYNLGNTSAGIYKDYLSNEVVNKNNNMFMQNYGNLYKNLTLDAQGNIVFKK